ncbi:hypothetical protein JYB62_02760 [Algoriphagus lutimaris]|uniref:hypothetical protein n=1 Tax=Algoriphagus lutimaris TaxID=613197 RepID=UPI00196A874D|nr:hypothetical protein [Algoriphagus lutimaris]MBN3518910.1 hypothetical protein [Algoriphagus lutimaris]
MELKTFPSLKKLFLLSLISILFFSCDNEDSDPDSIVGKWGLIEIYYPRTVVSSDEFVEENFQTYRFYSNGTFEKTRISEGEDLQTATGDYLLEQVPAYSSSEVKLYVNLEFKEGDNITNNCGQPDGEQLMLRFNNQLDNFSAIPCDGPGYIFQKESKKPSF